MRWKKVDFINCCGLSIVRWLILISVEFCVINVKNNILMSYVRTDGKKILIEL